MRTPAGTPGKGETMKWNELHPVMRRAIMREAVRRNVAIDQLFLSLGGAL